MTSSDDLSAFTGHQLWTLISQAVSMLRGSEPRSETDRLTVARTEGTLTYLEAYKNLPPFLIQSSRLSAAQNLAVFVSQIISQVQGWDQDAAMTPSTVSLLDNLCDNILGEIAGWPALQDKEWTTAVGAASEAFREASERSLQALEDTVVHLQSRLGAVESETSLLATEARERSAEAKEAVAAFNDNLRGQTVRADEALAANMVEIRAQASDQFELDREASVEYLAKLEDARNKADELLAFVTDGTVAGGYDQFAKQENDAYRVWNVVGIVVSLAVLVYLAFEFRNISSITSQDLWIRSALSVPALAVSAYCFQQATKRHQQSVEARYRALDLIALPPFTNSMQEEEKSKLRMILGERLFARAEETKGGEADTNISPANLDSLANLLKAMRDVFKP